MAKNRTNFVCQNCGASFSKWMGRCENCGEWNSLVEQMVESAGSSAVLKASSSGNKLKPLTFNEIDEEKDLDRIKTGFLDLDVVLGGGILPAGIILLAGQPGIGKSTLLMQLCSYIAKNRKVLYVSGEESASQVKLRAKRLGATNNDLNLSFIASTSANDIAKTIEEDNYELVIIDSIQTLSLNEISSAAGSVSQISNSATLISRVAKKKGSAVIFVGHVTKEGSIAGPKILEHMVDVVLNFEGDRYGGFKVIRAVKNRYGSTEEVAIFEMTGDGLKIVKNPSAALLAERQNSDGSIVLATLEGNRPILVEIQALVNPSNFGYPKRTASEDNIACFGEIGLGGEIRSVRNIASRIKEAKKMGFSRLIAPSGVKNKNPDSVTSLRDALNKYLK